MLQNIYSCCSGCKLFPRPWSFTVLCCHEDIFEGLTDIIILEDTNSQRHVCGVLIWQDARHSRCVLQDQEVIMSGTPFIEKSPALWITSLSVGTPWSESDDRMKITLSFVNDSQVETKDRGLFSSPKDRYLSLMSPIVSSSSTLPPLSQCYPSTCSTKMRGMAPGMCC